MPTAVARACEEIGFFTIIGHGIDSTLIARATGAARQFFEQPPADKIAVRSADTAISRGYRGIGSRVPEKCDTNGSDDEFLMRDIAPPL